MQQSEQVFNKNRRRTDKRSSNSLITRLRRHNVHPIVVYDERGVRDWKSQETRRRLADRSLHLARSLHEEKRLKRHDSLQELLKKCEALDEGQRACLKRVEDSWNPKEQSAVAAGQISGQQAGASKEEDLGTDDVVGELIQEWFTLRDECRSSSRPFIRRKATPPSTSEPAPTLEEMTEKAEYISDDDVEDDGMAKQYVEDDPMPPSKEYTESPRQTAMTAEEDVILEQMMQMAATSELPQSEWIELRNALDDLTSRSLHVAKTHDRGLDTPTAEDHQETRELLEAMGVPVVEAPIPYEAEGVASALARAGLVNWVGTEDSDVIAYEAPLLRNVTVGNKPLIGVNGADVREALGFDGKSFLDLMTLFGNDAIKRIYGVGPAKALKYLQRYGSIEGILQKEEKVRLLAGEGYLQEVHVSRQMFGQLPPIPIQAESLEGRSVSEAEINRFLQQRHGLAVAKLETFVEEDEDVVFDSIVKEVPKDTEAPSVEMLELASMMAAKMRM